VSNYASNPKVDGYIRGVLDGSLAVNELARLAIERHVADLDHWPCVARRGSTKEETDANNDAAYNAAIAAGHEFYFDEDAAHLILDFYHYCRFIDGDLEGEVFDPLPCQAAVDWISHGWMRTSTGARRFNERWIEEPRGNGKTYWLACHELYMLGPDGEPGARVYSVATKKDQVAKEGVWHDASWIVRKSPELAAEFEVQDSANNHRIFIPGEPCEFTPLPSEARRADTLKPHSISADEIHEWPKRLLYVKFKTATGKRRQAMLTNITTAGDDRPNTLYEELHTHAVDVLRGWRDGSFLDNEFFAIIYAIDSKADGCAEDADHWDEAEWHKANPALGFPGTGVRIDFLRSQANRAKTNPEALRDMLRLHLGRRVGAKEKAISDLQWRGCSVLEKDPAQFEAEFGPETARILRALQQRPPDWSSFEGRPAFAAADLSSARDLTSIAVYFPPWSDWPFETYRFFALFPRENLKAACDRDRAPYDLWAREGWLELTEGNEMDNAVVFKRALEINERYLIIQWSYDPWHALSLKNDMYAETGIEMVKFVQDLPSFGEPTRLFLDSIPGRKLCHDGNPLVKWCAANLVTKEDHHGNKRPHKGLSSYRIDPIVAAIMARGRAIVVPILAPPPQWDGHVDVW